jgi:pyruvate ferredoxin oxidoreductase beta subunit
MERGHQMLYVCYDNGAYMNTGFQRSSATPAGAWTSTSPVGPAKDGKPQHSKNLTEIMVAHRIPYVAQASPHDPRDLMRKAARALSTDGPTFLNVISPCPRGWRTESADGMTLARLATETCYWPLFEVEDGKYRLTYRPRDKRPLAEWLEQQGRFAHLARPGAEHLVDRLQHWVDDEWDLLLRKCDEIPEDQWRTTKERRSSRLKLHPHLLHETVLGEPLGASMTSNTIDWGAWGATASALSWGVMDD